MLRFKNKKLGKYYALLAHGTDTTNARDGLEVVIYSPDDNPHIIYVREINEFFDNFEDAGIVKSGEEPWNK